MDEQRTQFDYLLNAFELASQADKPAEHGYGEKRRALFAYVRDLERLAPPAAAVLQTELTDERIDAVLAQTGDVRYVLADAKERLRLFARSIEREVRSMLSAGQQPEQKSDDGVKGLDQC